jgi:hypothetical protein
MAKARSRLARSTGVSPSIHHAMSAGRHPSSHNGSSAKKPGRAPRWCGGSAAGGGAAAAAAAEGCGAAVVEEGPRAAPSVGEPERSKVQLTLRDWQREQGIVPSHFFLDRRHAAHALSTCSRFFFAALSSDAVASSCAADLCVGSRGAVSTGGAASAGFTVDGLTSGFEGASS